MEPSEAARWGTLRPRSTVLAVARTLTSAIRLLEALPVFAGDDRVRVAFTVDERSRNSDGVAELIRALPAPIVPWNRVADFDCDLVIAASEKLDLRTRKPVPMLVIPHGIGFHKHVPDVDSTGTRVSGLVDPAVLRGGQLRMLITHPSHRRQLAELAPATAGRTVLGGDTSFDLLTTSAPQRARYRAALGMHDHQRLVLVSSTWGGQSLLGTDPGLLTALVRQLPVDDYRVALVAHPNVWTWEGGWELRRVIDHALRGGLLLLEPAKGWHAAMVASDLVVGDHGSLSLYAATTGVPLRLAAFGDEVVTDTVMADLGRKATRLDRHRDLRAQVEQATGDQHAALVPADAVFAAPGQALRLLRTWCYDALGLPEPSWAQESPIAADPAQALPELHSLHVVGSVVDDTVVLRRHPFAATPHVTSSEVRHVSVDDRERDVRRFADAATIVRAAGPFEEASRWLGETLDAFPGCRMAGHATPTGCEVRLRDGRAVALTAPGPLGDSALLTSALYTLLVHAGELPASFELLAGGRAGRVTVSQA
ncbi:hypothetical protein A6A25_31050 [Saccharothrix sp. CB00851]|nr:hypothetical protein A6A25_31050 [Saccharothrix sp. CB00851]